jgi:hypothetical protein
VLILRGICHALGMDVQLAELWLPHARSALDDLPGLEARAARNAQLLGNK